MDSVVSSKQTAKGQGLGGWIGRHPGLIPLVIALALLFLLPNAVVAARSLDQPVEVGAERLSLLGLAWLGAGLILVLTAAIAGASVAGDLGAATRHLLRGSIASPGTASVDAPARGAAGMPERRVVGDPQVRPEPDECSHPASGP